jgi:hypothetical protein
MRKSQTATEYLILLAVVIVVALVVVNAMGGFPGIGASTSKKVSDVKLANDVVGISGFSIGTNFSVFNLKNNNYDTITITEFRLNQQSNLTCNSSNTVPALPIVLNIGQSVLVNCSAVNSSNYILTDKQTPVVSILYSDNLGAIRTAGNALSYNALNATSNEGNNGNQAGGNSSCINGTVEGFFNGTGTLANPFQICSCTMLQNVQNYLVANYTLISNIDCSDTINWNSGLGFSPIGCWDNPTCGKIPFIGTFEGNGFTINNLYINRTVGNQQTALFGYVVNNSVIQNFNLLNVNITGYTTSGVIGIFTNQMVPGNLAFIRNVNISGNVTGNSYNTAGICGSCFNVTLNNTNYLLGNVVNPSPVVTVRYIGGIAGTISLGLINNSFSNANIYTNLANVGGLVGIGSTNIYNSYSTGNVTGKFFIGGFIGSSSVATISNCYSTGNVSSISGSNGGVGGFCGEPGTSTILNSYSIGNVTSIAANNIGGFVGTIQGSTISNCFSTGSVVNGAGVGTPGGFLGKLTSGSLSNVYWFDTPGDNATTCYSGGSSGCTMKNAASGGVSYFYNSSNAPLTSWSFVNNWKTNTTYPILKWQS